MATGTSTDVRVLDNFIGGEWVPARAADWFDVHNPAAGEVIGRTPMSTAEDVDGAVRAATKAFPSWRDTPVNTRAQVLYKFKALLEANFEEYFRGLPRCPDPAGGERISKVLGKLEMPNTVRRAGRPGLAFVDDRTCRVRVRVRDRSMSEMTVKEGLTAMEVASFLRRHPGFLGEFPDIALTLVVPREQGSTTSLASYQLEVLRDKNRDIGRPYWPGDPCLAIPHGGGRRQQGRNLVGDRVCS